MFIRYSHLWAAAVMLVAMPAAHAQDADPVAIEPYDPARGDEFSVISPEGIPADVERLVRFYGQALSTQRPAGGAVEFAVSPDSNINRATRAVALGPAGGSTITAPTFGDVTAVDTMRPLSGTGFVLRGQGYLRRQISNAADLLVQLSGNASFYDQSQFDDYTLSAQAGPEYLVGTDRLAVLIGPTWRWYGTDPYSLSVGAVASWQHPLGNGGQLRVEGGMARVENRRDPSQDSWTISLSALFDRNLSARSGVGLQAHANREIARDRGYATVIAGAGAYGFREFGRTTAVITFAYAHLEADERLPFDLIRRVDDRLEATVAATFHALRLGALAPFARLRWERNWSRVPLYDLRRTAAEIGLTAAF